MNNNLNENFITTTYTYDIYDDFLFLSSNNNSYNYIEKNIDNVEIEIIYSRFYQPEITKNSNYYHMYHLYLNYKEDDRILFNTIIKDLNNNEYIDYSNFKINIYAKKENLQILKDNQTLYSNHEYKSTY